MPSDSRSSPNSLGFTQIHSAMGADGLQGSNDKANTPRWGVTNPFGSETSPSVMRPHLKNNAFLLARQWVGPFAYRRASHPIFLAVLWESGRGKASWFTLCPLHAKKHVAKLPILVNFFAEQGKEQHGACDLQKPGLLLQASTDPGERSP